MLNSLKAQVFHLIARPEAGRVLAARRRGRGVIFMLHRFACEENGWEGYSLATLKQFLGYLRASGVQLVSVDELLRTFESGVDPKAAPYVAFTIDDGFEDFGRHAVPVFAEYDCPSTVFVVPNVIARQTWFWWNKVEYVLHHTRVHTLNIETDGARGALRSETEADRADASKRLQAHIKTLPASEVSNYVARLAVAAEVTLPTEAPATYAVHDWNALRKLGTSGVTVGAHSMNHPILSRCTDDEVRMEIEESIARVRAECPNASDAFCYPNGVPGRDFTDRETSILARCPVRWALSAREGTLTPATKDRLTAESAGRFLVPRLGLDDDTLGRSSWLALGKQFAEPALWS
jgi:peptidoglycan/xylan/chitin deacetylase (PgdA/CDA1 family)